jgi:hypothetical protein
MRISDETLMAYVDGELDAGERARVEAAARTDAALARRIQAQRRLRERVANAFGGAMAEPPPERLMEAIRAQRAPAAVVDLSEARARRAAEAKPAPVPKPWARWVAIAACVVVVAGVAYRYAPLSGGPGGASMIGGPPGSLVAEGALAGALNQQLAAAGSAPGQAVRIGVSFHSTDGPYCRTFQVVSGDGFAGLACREASGWRVRMVVADAVPTAALAYRQAASETPAPILNAVDGMIAGAPLDAGQEAAARAKGWRG